MIKKITALLVRNLEDDDEVIVVAPLPNGDAAPMISWTDSGVDKLTMLAGELASRNSPNVVFYLQDFVRGEMRVLENKTMSKILTKKKVSKKRGKAKRTKSG